MIRNEHLTAVDKKLDSFMKWSKRIKSGASWRKQLKSNDVKSALFRFNLKRRT